MRLQKKNTISLYIVSKNYGKYLNKSINSVLNQTFKKEIGDRYFYRSATTGFIGIIFALNYFEKISLYGFNFYEGDWKQRHYYESCTKYTSEHSHHEENYVVHTLADQGYITIN